MWDWARNEETAKVILKARLEEAETKGELPGWCDRLISIVFISTVLSLAIYMLVFNQ
ncbi:MAG: hypothetical protein ACOWWO_00825 [Peptococcaceae bacterium]